MSCDPLLMKILVKKEICGSYEQYTRPTEQCNFNGNFEVKEVVIKTNKTHVMERFSIKKNKKK